MIDIVGLLIDRYGLVSILQACEYNLEQKINGEREHLRPCLLQLQQTRVNIAQSIAEEENSL
ncbi:MAG: hypothetical protein QNJ41_11930 [Xenococcaceae cyanobacterium MO_188.B32]|nr:hypothetical protein [Xenococcaceae cyanobacterium MO_188.B32]